MKIKDLSKEKANISKASLITLIVFVGVLGVMMTVFCVLYAVNKKAYHESSVNLENVYQRSFFDLVDDINNAEVKLGKLVNSTNEAYVQKLLSEIHESAASAQNNISRLPISMNGIPETNRFINQLNGFANVLSRKKSSAISASERETLNNLYRAVSDIKYSLANMSGKIANGYSISVNSVKNEKQDFTDFTQLFQSIKSSGEDYPTMIYDGPFSDSVVSKEIKGLSGNEISKDEAQEIAAKIFEKQEKSVDENGGESSQATKISYVGETNGKFKTFDFSISLENGFEYYAQITKVGGKLLTLSSFSKKSEQKISTEEAEKIAVEFAKKQGLENMECVWSGSLGSDTYLNLAPVENNVVLYPDLIKVKVDLSSGNILGWEASTFYTNHRSRALETPSVSKASSENRIPDGFKILETRLALSPLDFNREVLTNEVKAFKEGATYYFYFNAQTGNLENILKVVKTENGNLMM